jgi:hypothetical protein
MNASEVEVDRIFSAADRNSGGGDEIRSSSSCKNSCDSESWDGDLHEPSHSFDLTDEEIDAAAAECEMAACEPPSEMELAEAVYRVMMTRCLINERIPPRRGLIDSDLMVGLATFAVWTVLVVRSMRVAITPLAVASAICLLAAAGVIVRWLCRSPTRTVDRDHSYLVHLLQKLRSRAINISVLV